MNRNEMIAIYKYPLQMRDEQVIEIPSGAKILCVQVQHGTPCIWALVNKDEILSRVKVWVIGTGHDFPDECFDAHYLGTVQWEGGSLVFHVWYKQ